MKFLDAAEAVRDNLPGFDWRRLSPEEWSMRRPPRFLLGPVPETFADFFFGDSCAPSCGIYTIQDVSFSGDRLLQKDGVSIMVPLNGIHEASIREVIDHVSPVQERIIDESVVLLCGPAFNMYGHWLVDFLPRLGLLAAAGMAIDQQKYLLPQQLPAFAHTWLELLGIPAENILTYDIERDRCFLKEAIIPSNLRGHMRINTLARDIYAMFTRRVVGNRPPRRTDVLYVSRSNWGNDSRSMTNGVEIEERMKAAGCRVVYPETLSIPEQVELFYDARALIGEYGSGLHASVFAPAKTPVIAFHAAEIHPAFLQSGLCEACGQDCAYIFGALTGEQPHAFHVARENLDRLERFLPSLLQENS
ncbi:glycosyltransferase family 61 protein [Acetobacter sp.]|uniref:glycosyltransferase family 61 protein n=1 Tax=Acetobacter sp. TaxID=440 RepID=UPI0039E9599C